MMIHVKFDRHLDGDDAPPLASTLNDDFPFPYVAPGI
jgi:hypothetical protein